MTMHGAGMIQCLREQGISSLWNWCMDVGAPAGTPFLTGLPQIYLGWLVNYLPFIGPWEAHQISNALVDAIALIGGYMLMRRWSAPRWVALLTSTVYLTSLSITRMNGFAYTFSGFVLLPAYIAVALWILDQFVRGRRLWATLATFILAFVVVFTDGYSFFGAALAIGALVLVWGLQRREAWRSVLWAIATFGAAIVSAGLAFLVYTPDNVAEVPVGIGAFRYLGLDIATLFIPQPSLWWASEAGLPSLVGELWGDGSNVAGNYVGFSVIGLIAWWLWRGRRRQSPQTRSEVFALLAVALVALVLSLGPALKVFSMTQEITPEWDVPTSMTTLGLPTTWLYESMAGFDAMRATYRWFVVTRFVLVFASGVALGAIWRSTTKRPVPAEGLLLTRTGAHRWAQAATCLLAVLMVAETAVNVPAVMASGAAHRRHVDAIRYGIVPEMAAMIRPGERFLVVPTRNDFMLNGVIPFTEGIGFNSAPDKNYNFARASWPDSVVAAADAVGEPEQNAAFCQALAAGDTDAIVISYLDPHYDARSWPPDADRTAYYQWLADGVAQDARFDVTRGAYLSVIRLGPECDDGR
ncbi:hypothetical protein [Cellulomonas chengniuliangii]|uniref:Glycosyltransferase RgtA/B/C/D-like domain-containing protein n=1 Tax=Cellulomonas chengniuliangii TaxID=2968084 RepID=A0ABY5KZ47_9CELL|nr:hypothetical protein [Cellulomonas chengniuliangii]MCC2310063.1 hypothetical protein [Cellulomonas chengniuliangii]UUI74542.1 hypothetical protein NP064_12145 [Cellulomonas chengniuliangii]